MKTILKKLLEAMAHRLRGPMRSLRNFLILAAVVWVFADTQGVPHLRVDYRYIDFGGSRIYVSARYWSPLGWRHSAAGEFAEGCPIIVLIPPEPSLTERALKRIKNWL